MITSGGHILAIDKVNTDGYDLEGDGVKHPLKVKTKVVLEGNGIDISLQQDGTVIISRAASKLVETPLYESGTNVQEATLQNEVYNHLGTVNSSTSALRVIVPKAKAGTVQDCQFEFSTPSTTSMTSFSAVMDGELCLSRLPEEWKPDTVYQCKSLNGIVSVEEF